MKPFIENVSLHNIRVGKHTNPGDNSVLIQIVDTNMEFPRPYHNFSEVYQFKIQDWEIIHPDSCTQEQAKQLVDILRSALDSNKNVIVHCVMGVSRSGAVTEVGTIMGFEDTKQFRIPNYLIKKRMMQELGLTYNHP